jgi:hypothetical protein
MQKDDNTQNNIDQTNLLKFFLLLYKIHKRNKKEVDVKNENTKSSNYDSGITTKNN